MRFAVAPASMFIDAWSRNEKGRPDSVAASGATRGEHCLETDQRECANTRASLTLTHPGKRTRQSWQALLSPRPVGQSTGLTMNALRFETQVLIVSLLTEGCSIRSTERLTQTHRDSGMRLGVRVGEGCARLHDRLMRDLQVNVIELDEQRDFIAKKAKRVQTNDPAEFGDVWLFLALAATQKAIISYRVGKRSQENTLALARDLRARILNRPHITSDGYAPYVGA